MTQSSPVNLDSKGLLAGLCATATWGMSGIFVRWLPGWSPFAVLGGRFLVATVALSPIFLLVPSFRQNLIGSLRTPLVWGLSLPAIASGILGTAAFQMAPVGEVTLLFTTSPLFIVAYRSMVRLPVKAGEGLGMLLAMAGVGLIILPQLSDHQTTSWQMLAGYLMALGAAGALALYASWFDKLARQHTAPRSVNVVFVTCALGSTLSFLCEILFSKLSILTSTSNQIFLIFLCSGILSTVLPLLCYTIASQRLPIILATAILLLEPVFAVLFAAIALHEIPTFWFGIGSVLVLWGLLSIAKEASVNPLQE